MTIHVRLHRGGCMDPSAQGWETCPTCGAKPEPPDADGSYVSSDALPSWARRQAIEAARQAVADARQRRTERTSS